MLWPHLVVLLPVCTVPALPVYRYIDYNDNNGKYLQQHAILINQFREAAVRFMAMWHENEAKLGMNRYASAAGGAQWNRKGG